MKRLFLLLIVIVSVITINAQDKIITKEGDVIQGYSVEVSSSAVFYKVANTAESSFQRLDKSTILMIRKQDGTKIYMDAAPDNTANETTVSTEKPAEQKEQPVSEESIKENKKKISLINNSEVRYINDKKRGDDANRVFCQLAVGDGSVMINDDLEISCSIKYGEYYGGYDEIPKFGRYCNPTYFLTVKNKTKKTIYLDLGNTFFTSNGQTSVYYVPTSTTSSSSRSAGAGVNLGAVAGALNIGGVAGTLAGGVNVGGGTTKGTSNTVYSQRVVAVPPMSNIELDPQMLFITAKATNIIANGMEYIGNYMGSQKGSKIACFYFTPEELKCGETLFYSEDNSPLKFNTYVTYSYTEDCAANKNVQISLYLKKLIGMSSSNVSGKDWIDMIKHIQRSPSTIGFAGFTSKLPSYKSGTMGGFPKQ